MIHLPARPDQPELVDNFISGHRKSVATADNDRQLYELKIFHDVAKALTSTLDLDTILQTIMEKMAAYFEPATWSLVMIRRVQPGTVLRRLGRQGAEGLGRTSTVRWCQSGRLGHRPWRSTLVIENVNADPMIDPDSRSEWFEGQLSQWFAYRCGRLGKYWASSSS